MTETALTKETGYIKFLLQLFKYQFKLETAIGVLFNLVNKDDYTVEWIMITSENLYNEKFEQVLEKEKLWSNVKRL